VLGSVRSPSDWHFAAYGKHPALKDYFSLGQSTSLGQAFYDWVKNGYQMVEGRRGTASGHCSWRFWARTAQKEGLSCGLVRDSCDSLGRSYPFLILGSGILNGWEEYWDLLPLACERAWNQMESLSTRMFKELRHLEDEMRNIQPPSSNWVEMVKRREKIAGDHFRVWEKGTSKLIGEAGFFIPLDQEPTSDQPIWISLGLFLFKKKGEVVPNAIFMGGSLDKTFLAFFKRPLMLSDFMQLWSISSRELRPVT